MRLRWGLCWYGRAPVKRHVAGSIPATAAFRKGKPTGDGSRPESGRAMSLEGSTPSPSADGCPWPIGRGTSFPSWAGGFDSRRAFCVLTTFRGRRCWYVMRGFEPRGRRFDSCPRSLGDELVATGECQQKKPMRGRSTVGRDALNVLMLVRFQPPQLSPGSHPAG